MTLETVQASRLRFDVLDHGYVRYVDHMGNDEAIVEAARMSTGKGFIGWEAGIRCERCGRSDGDGSPVDIYCTNGGPHQMAPHVGDERLLAFMYSHQHMTPFEFGVLHIEVQAPLMVFREWHRHRMQSFSEASARYTQMPNEHYVPALDRFEPKQTGNKQESSAAVGPNTFAVTPLGWQGQVQGEQEELYEAYETMLKAGVPKEVARINTPVSRYSKMRATTDLRNWLAFLMLRDAPTAQWEIQQYAKAVGEIVKALWPRTYALFEEHTKYAVTLSRRERTALTKFLESSVGSGLQVDGVAIDALFKKLKGTSA